MRNLPRITAHNKPIYDELIKPAEKKIVWYSPPKKQLPDVSAQQRIGTFPKPRAPIKSSVAIIATAPKPKSVKQFIWQPVPKVRNPSGPPGAQSDRQGSHGNPGAAPASGAQTEGRQAGHARREISSAQHFTARARTGT